MCRSVGGGGASSGGAKIVVLGVQYWEDQKMGEKRTQITAIACLT